MIPRSDPQGQYAQLNKPSRIFAEHFSIFAEYS
jgi:hypothetical protein